MISNADISSERVVYHVPITVCSSFSEIRLIFRHRFVSVDETSKHYYKPGPKNNSNNRLSTDIFVNKDEDNSPNRKSNGDCFLRFSIISLSQLSGIQ